MKGWWQILKNRKHFLGILCALMANIIFGFSFIFSKMALSVSKPLIILAVRFTIAFLFLNVFLCLGVFKMKFKIFKTPTIWLMALAQPFLYFIFELYGLSLVSSALSGVIIALVPVAVMLMSALILKEKPTFLQWFFTIISIIGISVISIISNDGNKNHSLGIILLIVAVICAAIFNILSRKQSSATSPFERTYAMFFIGFVGFNIIAIMRYNTKFIPLVLNSFKHSEFIFAIFYLAVISSVLAFLIYNFATTNITVIEASSFSNIITVVTVLAGVFVLNESLNLWEYILCGMIIIGVWGVNWFVSPVKNRKKYFF